MLKAINLYKSFNNGSQENHVINGVELEIGSKEFVVISGKSGSGKSTLLYLLNGLEKPTKGSVVYNNENIGLMDDNKISYLRRTTFGFIFQFYNLVSSLSVKDNIKLPLEIDHRLSKKELDKIDYYAELIGINDKLKSFPHQLSGGQQQRVAIARALSFDPEVIFADEPTGNLDSTTSDEVLKVFEDLHKKLGKTVIMVTHDDSISKRYATREIKIQNGKVVK